MGNVARTPRLVDLTPGKGAASAFLIDRVTTSATWDDEPTVVMGKAIAPGKRTLGIVFDGGSATISAVAKSDLTGWESVSAQITPAITTIARERLNKVLAGTGAPTLGTNWRTKAPEVVIPKAMGGGRKHLPVSMVGDLTTGRWGVGQTKGSATVRATKVAAPIVIAPAPAPAGGGTVTGRAAERKAALRTTAGGSAVVGATVGVRRAARLAEAEAAKAAAPVVAPEPKVEPVAPVVAPKVDPGIFRYPKALPWKVHQDPAIERGLERALKVHLSLRPRTFTVIGLRGPTGTGKTLGAENLAAKHGLPFLKIDAAGMVTFADWVGAVSLDSTEAGIVTRYAPSLFIEAIRADGPYAGMPRIVLIDEITRIAGSSAGNALLPILDGSGTIYVPDARQTIHVDRAVLFVVTANIGSQYAGTVTLDSALANRITNFHRVDYPSTEVETTIVVEQSGCTATVANALVRVAQATRTLSTNRTIDQPGVSTRQLVRAGIEVAVGGATPLEAALETFINHYDDEGGASSSRAAVLAAAEGVLRGMQTQ